MKTLLGTQLHPNDRAHVLAAYVHHFTREHVPQWSRDPMPNGKPYPVQFASDADWLAHTRFPIRKDGRLDQRAQHCESNPTWPDNPELRRSEPANPV